jgi:putative spermidine/putrescine transport system permease protein
LIRSLSRGVFCIVNILIFVYILAPIVILIGASFSGESYMEFPPKSLSLRWFETVLDSPAYLKALSVSFKLGLYASLIALAIGTLTAYGLERLSKGWRNSLNVLFNSPLQIPTVVLGIALMQLFNSLDIQRSFSTLLAGHVILCLPYVVRTVGAFLFRFDRTVEEAALTLGASGPRVFWKISLPLLRPALIASIIFTFVVSFGNLAISMFLTSSRLTTLPIQMLGYVAYSPDPGIAAISTIIIIITLIVMYLLERLIGLDRMF